VTNFSPKTDFEGDGQDASLTRKEYHLLRLLASHLGLVISHNQLIKDLWGNASPDNIQYLRTLVRQLRQKLEANPSEPKLLLSESGVGYRWRAMRPHRQDRLVNRQGAVVRGIFRSTRFLVDGAKGGGARVSG
jgi:DNA-binding winged helix-turn-helix (wHTH) protein